MTGVQTCALPIVSQSRYQGQVISKETAAEMKRMLIKTVQEGTGRSARIEGLEIGGKTGTAQIAGGTGYLKKYISSFVGFVNDDKGNSYTIGVTVINPNSILFN